MVEPTPFKNIAVVKSGIFPKYGWKITNIWNHHLVKVSFERRAHHFQEYLCPTLLTKILAFCQVPRCLVMKFQTHVVPNAGVFMLIYHGTIRKKHRPTKTHPGWPWLRFYETSSSLKPLEVTWFGKWYRDESWWFFVICPQKTLPITGSQADYQNYIIVPIILDDENSILKTNSRLGPWWTPIINWPLDFHSENCSPQKILHLRETLRREGGWNLKWRSALRWRTISEVTILEQCSKLKTPNGSTWQVPPNLLSRWYNFKGIIYFISHYNEYIMIMASQPNPHRNKGMIFCLI